MIKSSELHCGYSNAELLSKFTVELLRGGHSPRKVLVSPATWEWLRIEFDGRCGVAVVAVEADSAAITVMLAGRQLTVLANPRLDDQSFDFTGCE